MACLTTKEPVSRKLTNDHPDCAFAAAHWEQSSIKKAIYGHIRSTCLCDTGRGDVWYSRTSHSDQQEDCHRTASSKNTENCRFRAVQGKLWRSWRSNGASRCTHVLEAWPCSTKIVDHHHETEPFRVAAKRASRIHLFFHQILHTTLPIQSWHLSMPWRFLKK
jgi:hypothetical protein